MKRIIFVFLGLSFAFVGCKQTKEITRNPTGSLTSKKSSALQEKEPVSFLEHWIADPTHGYDKKKLSIERVLFDGNIYKIMTIHTNEQGTQSATLFLVKPNNKGGFSLLSHSPTEIDFAWPTR